MRPAGRDPTWTIFRKEIRDLARDRRAIFFGLVLPVLLYPALYHVARASSPADRSAKPLRVGACGVYEDLLPLLRAGSLEVVAEELSADRVRKGEIALHLRMEPSAGAAEPEIRSREAPGAGARRRVSISFLSTSFDSGEALRRVRAALEAFEESWRRDLSSSLGLKDGGERPPPELIDLSTPHERGLAKLGRLLPALIVILLLSGGSVVALDLVAGEKERGTLETLCVQPVPIEKIVAGKFLALLAASCVVGVVNCFAMLLALVVGPLLGSAPAGLDLGASIVPPLGRLGVVLVLTVPLAVLTSAVLLLVSAHARSFREAQTALFPISLLSLAPVALAASPHARLDGVLSVVPIAGIALAIREAVSGSATVVPCALAVLATVAYAALALSRAARLLRREEVILSLDPPYTPDDARSELRWRRGIVFGLAMLLALYYGASWLQSRDPLLGLALTLWGLVLLPALAWPLAARAPFRATLGLRATPVRNLALGVPVAICLAILITAYMALQDRFLHAPRAIEEVLRDLLAGADVDWITGVLLFAVSPAICEELLWRGAFQGELEPRGRPFLTVLVVSAFFGLFHQSIYRLIPTALVGAVLATVRLRTGSIFPCMVIHGAYNLLPFVVVRLEAEGRLGALEGVLASPWWALGAAAVLPPCLAALRRRPVPPAPGGGDALPRR